MSSFRVAVLASGTGTNLQAILDQLHGRDGIEVVGVASDKPDAMALERAGGAGVETGVFPDDDHPDRGAREVHMRISAPPIKHPCHYGIDMSTREEMIAHERTVEEVAGELGADSLAYLSLDGVYEAVGTPRGVHCDACFSGDYPLGDEGEGNGKFALEELPVVSATRS